MAHPKIAAYLDAKGDPKAPDFLRSIVVLGPQEHAGKRYEVISKADGKRADQIPLAGDGTFDHARLDLVVTKVAAADKSPEK
jgi:hypothetical protein